MKKLYLFLVLALGIITIQAQNFTFSNNGVAFTNELNVSLNGRGDTAVFVHFTNVTQNEIKYKVQLVKMQMSEEANALMCFEGTGCLSDTITSERTIAAGETFEGFDLLYQYSSLDLSIVKVNFLNSTTGEVLQSFNANFAEQFSNPVILEKSIPLSLSAYPNPATNYSTIKYSIPSRYSNAKIVVRNTLGAVIKTMIVKGGTTGRVSVNASDLNNGVYFYSIIADGTTLSTKKLVVKH